MSVRGRPFTDRRGCSDETHLPCGRGSETRPPRSSLVDRHRVNAPNSTSAKITTCSQTGVGDCTQANRVQAPGSASLKSSPSSSASRAAKVASSAVNGSASAVPVVPVVRRPACQASSDDWGSGAVVRGCVEPWTPDDWDNWMIQVRDTREPSMVRLQLQLLLGRKRTRRRPGWKSTEGPDETQTVAHETWHMRLKETIAFRGSGSRRRLICGRKWPVGSKT